MIQSFKDKETEDIFNGRRTKSALKICPQRLWNVAFRKLDQLDSVIMLDELRIPPGNHLEALSGERAGQYSIRINQHSESASCGLHQAPIRSKSPITIKAP
jgi:proteic killer suppression protein